MCGSASLCADESARNGCWEFVRLLPLTPVLQNWQGAVSFDSCLPRSHTQTTKNRCKAPRWAGGWLRLLVNSKLAQTPVEVILTNMQVLFYSLIWLLIKKSEVTCRKTTGATSLGWKQNNRFTTLLSIQTLFQSKRWCCWVLTEIEESDVGTDRWMEQNKNSNIDLIKNKNHTVWSNERNDEPEKVSARVLRLKTLHIFIQDKSPLRLP